MSNGIKRILIFLTIIIVCSFLFNNPNKVNTSSSISEIVEIVDKDNNLKEEELIIEKEDDNNQDGSNLFVLIIEGISTLVISIFSLVFKILESVISSFTAIV